MTQPFENSVWYRALPLAERVSALYEAHQHATHPEGTELARRRVRRWRSQSPFGSDELFNRRLAQLGLSEQQLCYLLDEPPEAVARHGPPPAWVGELEQALSLAGTRLVADESDLKKKVDGFLYLVEPLLAWGRREAERGIRELLQHHPGAPFEVTPALRALYLNLPQRLFSMMQRTLVLELQVDGLQGKLEGDTPDARFSSFLRRLREPEARLGILREYAVMSRQLVLGVRQWLEVGLEFLERLCMDWEAVRESILGTGEPGKLVAVNEGGDRHHGGRSVRVCEFSSGARLVYKPRSLAGDVHFQELLTWLNARGDCLPFRVLKLVDRGTHGWCEFVTQEGCTSEAQVRRFFERQGGNLALHYALHSTDIHFENLIAAGEHPLLVDLESLFQPRLLLEGDGASQAVATRAVASSVLRVSLLPTRLWADSASGYGGIDVSGMEAPSGQLSVERVLQWEQEGTDAMRVTRRRTEIEGGKNRPALNGGEVSAFGYIDEVVAGFKKVYRLLLEHRDELLSPEGPLERFAGDRTRVIVRHTMFYNMLLQESFHPDVLRNALERDRLFDRLWFGLENEPHLARVIVSEHEDLWRGDVPSFSTRPGSHDIWDSVGRRIPDFLTQSGLELVRGRFAELEEEDLRRQVWFIQASMSTLAASQHKAQASQYRLIEPTEPPASSRLLAAAEAVGDRLESLALRGKDDATWVGLTLNSSVEPLWVDLYDGVPGIALFYAYLGAVTGKARYSELSRMAWTNVRRQMEAGAVKCTSVGLFSGWGGILYVLAHLASLWEEPALLAEAEAVLDKLPALIDKDEELDLLGGSAGCILALSVLRRAAPGLSERTLALATRCGERLLARAQVLPTGIGWTNGSSALQPLSGLAHGAAGIAVALLDLAVATGDTRFREAALAALAHERGVFLPEVGNWRDLRDPRQLGRAPDEVFCSMGWCHGAPGIGLARLRGLEFFVEEKARSESMVALETTSARGFGMNHSLCHGDLGNLDLLLKASEVLEDGARWRHRASLLGGAILQSIGSHGWQCGNPSKVEMPGLMTGLAGIGYGLLRLVDPARVPSVLTFDPPRRPEGKR